MKYAVLLLVLMFAGCKNGYEKVGETIVAGERIVANGKVIEVAKEDLPNMMNWNDAMSACEGLSNGWRLPSMEELEAMHEQLYLNGKGNFRTDEFYWSSSEFNANRAWTFSFEHGRANTVTNKTNTVHVRAVRTLP